MYLLLAEGNVLFTRSSSSDNSFKLQIGGGDGERGGDESRGGVAVDCLCLLGAALRFLARRLAAVESVRLAAARLQSEYTRRERCTGGERAARLCCNISVRPQCFTIAFASPDSVVEPLELLEVRLFLLVGVPRKPHRERHNRSNGSPHEDL